jgi:type I restriction enzyme M protein
MVNASTIKSIQKIMRKDAGVDGDAQRLGQLVWMIFLKIFDDREYEWEALEPGYVSPIPPGMRWRDWAANDEGLTGEDLIQFVNSVLFPDLKNLAAGTQDGRAFVVGSVFRDAFNYMKSGQLLRQVVNKIQSDIDFNKSGDRHAFGDLYEQLLRDLQSAGSAGEYYTPRAVTQFMVDMVDPRLGEVVLDPACGTGGFLTCTLEHLRSHYVRTAEDEQVAQASIFGVEKKPLPHLLCTTNMILHGIDVPTNIRHDNTLTRPLRSYGPADRVDVIITNPPFGGTEEDGIEANFPTPFRTRETADLFLVLIVHLLKPNGRAAVVLPDGWLEGIEPVQRRIKEHLLTECELHTIDRLPANVFAPYSSVKTNLLFLRKGSPTRQIWYYEHPLPPGQKSYSKTKPIRLAEFQAEREWWASREAGAQAWQVDLEGVEERHYGLDFPNPSSAARDVDVAAGFGQLQGSLAAHQQLILDLRAAVVRSLAAEWSEQADTIGAALEALLTERDGIPAVRQSVRQLVLRGAMRSGETAGDAEEYLTTVRTAWRPRLPEYIGDEHFVESATPPGWARCRLGNIVEFQYGKSYPKVERLAEGEIPVLGANGPMGYAERALVERPCVVVGRKGSVGAVNLVAERCWPTDVTYFVTPPNGMSVEFLFLLLSGMRLNALARGLKPGLRREEAYMLPVLLPPLDEQQRIVELLSGFEEMYEQLQASADRVSDTRERLRSTLSAATALYE